MILTRLPPGEWNTSQDYGPLARAQEKCTLYPRQQTVPREGSSCWKCRAGAACWVGTSQWRKYAMQECRALIQICKGMQLEAMWRDKKLREDIGDDPSQWAKRLKGAFGNASHVQVNSDDPEPSGNSHTESEAETSPSFGCTSLACVLHHVSTDFASRRFCIHWYFLSGWPKRWVISSKNSGKAMSNCRQGYSWSADWHNDTKLHMLGIAFLAPPASSPRWFIWIARKLLPNRTKCLLATCHARAKPAQHNRSFRYLGMGILRLLQVFTAASFSGDLPATRLGCFSHNLRTKMRAI